MTLITFNKIRPVIIYPVLAMITHLTNIAFVAMSGYSFTDQEQDQDKDQIKQIKNNNYLILLSIIMFSEVITFIFYFIQKRNTEQKMKRKLKILPKTLKNKIKSILIIILIVCINFPSTVIQLYIFQNNFLEFLEKIVNGLSLVFATILCALILNYRYYKHHVVGLCILLTGHTLFSVYDLYVTGENAEFPDMTNIILFIALYIWVSVQEVLEKYLMEKHYLSPYLIIGLEGICGIVVMCLVFIIIIFTSDFYSVNCDNFKHLLIFIWDHPFIIVIDILFLLSVFAYNIFRLLTNQFYSPTYICVSTVFGDFFKWVCTIVIVLIAIALGEDDKEEKETSIPSAFEYIVKFLAYGLMIFGIFLYLEIIQLNIFELDANTKVSIMERTDKEIDEKAITEITLCENIEEENEVEEDEYDDKAIQ